MGLFNRIFPPRPKLKVEIWQVCLDRVLASLTEDWSSYTFDLYFLVYAWIVNKKQVATTVKEWKMTVISNKRKTQIQAEFVPDISEWKQHVKVMGTQHGLPVIKDIHNNLAAFPAQTLQHGIPAEGWVCFVAHGVTETLLKDAAIKLVVVDSFDRKHTAESEAPWPCKGEVVNPEMPWST